MLALSLVYFGAVATNYGLSFFLPQIVKAFGVSNFQAGLVAALPYVVGLVSIVLWGRRSDRKLERRFHLAFPLFVASAGIAISTALDDPTMKMAGVVGRGLRHLRLPAGVLDVSGRLPVRARRRPAGSR